MRNFFLFSVGLIHIIGACTPEKEHSVATRWTEERANAWYDSLPWIKGFNYVPSYVGNTTEWWENELDTSLINRELTWAEELGYTSARVFIQYIVWKKDPEALKQKFAIFLEIAARHGISVMPVLFDDCAGGEPVQRDPYLGKQKEVIPGMALSTWTPSPGLSMINDPDEEESLRRYIHDMLETFSDDRRIILWDLYNEPSRIKSPDFVVKIFAWAREVNPTQPISIAFMYSTDLPKREILIGYSDVISFHLYEDRDKMEELIEELKQYNRPVLCTEWMSRTNGSNFETDLPLFMENRIAAYQWGLVNGKSQAHYPWGNRPGGEADSTFGWKHDILHPDGTPYRQEEIDIIIQY